jgi:outer membrane protein TolC
MQARLLVPPDLELAPPDTVAAVGQPSVPQEPEVFGLPEAVGFALANNPRLRAARAEADRARGQSEVAFAPFLPTVHLSYRFAAFSSEIQPNSEQLSVVVGLGEGTQAFAQGELQLQWTVHDFGRTAGRYGRAVSQQRIAELRARRAEETVAFDTTAAYLQVLYARASRVVREQSVRRAEAVLKDTIARRKGGVAEREDVLRAEVQLSETREALATARKDELDAVARLNQVMGRNVSLPLKVRDVEGRPEFALTLATCLEIAAARRPETEIARLGVAAAQYGLDAARAEFCPRIFVKGLVSRVDGEGVEVGDVEAAGLHFEQRIYSGGALVGQRASAAAEVRGALAGGQQILDLIALEVNLAFREIATARERIGLAETSIAQAAENLRLVRVRYLNGNATPTDIVDAETTLTRSQQRFHAAIYEYLTALARLDYATGRPQGAFWGPAPPARLALVE